MVSSVEEKMNMMMENKPYEKKNNMKMMKKMGSNNGEIRQMGRSNKKFMKRMGV